MRLKLTYLDEGEPQDDEAANEAEDDRAKITPNSAAQEVLIRIDHIRHHVESLQAIQRYLQERFSYHDKTDYGTIWEKLHEAELGEWRNLFMFGLVVDDATRDRIKAAAYDRFLKDRSGLMSWISGSPNPSHWLSSQEDEFRRMAQDLFQPKKGNEAS